MGDANRDVLPIDLAMGLTRYALRTDYRMTPRVASVDADDCAPGLEMEPGRPEWGTAFEFVCDHSGEAGALSLSAARPSPGDDITRAAFDVVDQAAE